ncbi:fimbrial protein [Pseudomonas chlororaphis]|uniref:fimbrial protein n=1 Tax=Pseudomonas chlororaphis TaxID=587753 RepID=UPI0007B3A3D3|nr:fimbrial protein [Pseudomonas chlororaphis]AZC64068.1 putative exported protein [Pseudomonas chlororaphis subsp. piscium]AZC70292.1 putative exported protein [Pseudomonas chlororaphis subsp. piscium]KZO48824.1 fimbrial protein [Pseudomonas chlororaphis subsp. piscium]MBP5069392.1 fimbrial protein [Pseudomonas chlororaphis]UQS88624.1 fimbrial protein [Pseudomonas chlororaphis subsp. piscium]
MKRVYQLVFLVLLFVLTQKSYALACKKDSTQSNSVITINTSIAVPNALPKDTVLWRSDNYSVSITCWQDQMAGTEFVYFYLSPRDPSLTQLGPDLELGINLNGADLRCTQLERCRVRLPIQFNGCSLVWGPCTFDAQTFTLGFNFFLSKRSPPSAGKEGSLTTVSSYPAFQLDGVGGINSKPGSNFYMTLAGLNQLRYIACASTLSISPKTIDFGAIPTATAQTDKVIKEVPFSISATKSCNSAYGLNAVLKPVAAMAEDGYTLVPNDNPSVGIRLLKQQDHSALPFNKEFNLVAYSSDQVTVNNLLAELKWRTGKPTLGKFNAAATIDVFYK